MTMTIDQLHGRVMDLDSHEMAPFSRYEEMFGERGRRFCDAAENVWRYIASFGPDDPNNTLIDRPEVAEITPASVWEVKGSAAPSASELSRRPEVLDAMGIHRQLIFPGFGMVAFIMSQGGGSIGSPLASDEMMKLSWGAIDAHNEWAAGLTNRFPDRLRVVGILPTAKPGATPQSLVTETAELLKTGVKAIYVASGLPPAGLSPADDALDPWYAALAEANVPLVFHTGGSGFLKSEIWGRIPRFRYRYDARADTTGVPYHVSQIHLPVENFIAVMTMGAVFERHPTLRVGVIETGASWIGPLAERLDVLADSHRLLWVGAEDLKLRPSEYIARNVRVTPLNHEPVELWFERYPMLRDVYCFSTDFPHVEGRRHSLERVYDRLAPLGDDVVEKFFCTNGQLILP